MLVNETNSSSAMISGKHTNTYLPHHHFSLAHWCQGRTKIEGSWHFSASAKERQVSTKRPKMVYLLKLSLPSTPGPRQQGTDRNHQACSQLSLEGITGRLSSVHLCPQNWAAGWLQLTTPPWQPPLPRLCIITACPSAGVELTVLTLQQFWRLHSLGAGVGSHTLPHAWAVTNCAHENQTKPCQEISSSGDSSICSAHLLAVVQFKDRINWQKDLMFQKDTIDYGTGTGLGEEKNTGANVGNLREDWWPRRSVSSFWKS